VPWVPTCAGLPVCLEGTPPSTCAYPLSVLTLYILIPRKVGGNVWVVNMIDDYTKVVEFDVIYTKTPITLAKTFYNTWICRYGVPGAVTTDNGNEFETDFKNLLSRLGIKHINTSINHPSANGTVERMNKTIKTMLVAHFDEHPQNWTFALPHLRNAYMSRPHLALGGMTPYDMLYGFCPKFPLSNMRSLLRCKSVHLSPHEHVQTVNETKTHLYSKAELTLREKFHKLAEQRLRATAAKRTHTIFKEGDFVIELPNQKGVSTNKHQRSLQNSLKKIHHKRMLSWKQELP
jgi:hypothetical protein